MNSDLQRERFCRHTNKTSGKDATGLHGAS